MEKEENIIFDYVTENGQTVKAEVLTLFSIDGYNKKYALCSIPAADGNFDIMAFVVNEGQSDEVSFDDITDEAELSVVTEAANNIMNR